MRTLPIPPAPELIVDGEKPEAPKRFQVVRYASDALLETNLNRLSDEGYELRKVNGEWIDEPKDPQPSEHTMDALRYYFVNRHSPAKTTSTQVRYS